MHGAAYTTNAGNDVNRVSTLCPTLAGRMGDTTSHKDVSLVFLSTFEPISLYMV